MPLNGASEEILKKKGITYYKDEKAQIIFIPKSEIEKIGDYTIRTLATPVTASIDVAGAVVVFVGEQMVDIWNKGWPRDSGAFIFDR